MYVNGNDILKYIRLKIRSLCVKIENKLRLKTRNIQYKIYNK